MVVSRRLPEHDTAVEYLIEMGGTYIGCVQVSSRRELNWMNYELSRGFRFRRDVGTRTEYFLCDSRSALVFILFYLCSAVMSQL